MKSEGLNTISIDYEASGTPDSVRQTHPLIYLEGNTYYCILGPDPQTGIFGSGPSLEEALQDFDKKFQDLIANPKVGDPVSDFIQQRHI